jgi:hypothetical protein
MYCPDLSGRPAERPQATAYPQDIYPILRFITKLLKYGQAQVKNIVKDNGIASEEVIVKRIFDICPVK